MAFHAGSGGIVTGRSLERVSTVDALVAAIRTRILDGDLPPGIRLREVSMAAEYGVSRHTLRSAVHALAAQGLVELEPDRGARVATLNLTQLGELFELRTALELEAAYLALERGEGHLPSGVHGAVAHLAQISNRRRASWHAVAEAHATVHSAIVAASQSRRIIDAYTALASEMQLFLVHLRPTWPLARMGPHHDALLRGLEARGPSALRDHIRDGFDAVAQESFVRSE